MTAESDLAASYRDRAKQLRAIADLDADKQTVATLRKIASDYEKMAAPLTATDEANAMRHSSLILN